MAKHAVVRTDNMQGTDVRAGLVSARYMGKDGKTPTAIDNGHVLKITELLEGERELYAAVDVAADDDLAKVVLVATPELMYEGKRSLAAYTNEEGKNLRCYHLYDGDTFSVTKDAIDGEAKAGSVIELAAGTKLKVSSGEAAGTAVGKVIAIDLVSGLEFVVIKVGL
jgi:hypothetical protein